jgi:aldehyde:ferredoxin oxidoreductase
LFLGPTKDDSLPGRFLTEKLHTGPHAGFVPSLEDMLGDYYSCRGWSEEGIPTREKLIGLGLEETIRRLIHYPLPYLLNRRIK